MELEYKIENVLNFKRVENFYKTFEWIRGDYTIYVNLYGNWSISKFNTNGQMDLIYCSDSEEEFGEFLQGLFKNKLRKCRIDKALKNK